MKFAVIVIIGAILTIGNAGCQRRSDAASKPEPAPAATNPNAVELDPAMLANVKIEPAQSEASARTLTATGKVQFDEDQTARILAPLPGQALDLNVRVGDIVTKDQVLFSIKSREVAALVTDYLQGQRDQDLAQKTYSMTQDLFEHQAASKISLQQAEADVHKAKAQVERAEEALRVLGLDPKEVIATSGLRALVPVRCPISGSVIERVVTSGQFVQADSTALLTIADLSTVWVLVDVYEQDLHLVHAGQQVHVTATAYPERRFIAKVDRISDRVDPDSRTLKVRLLVSNPGLLLKPEMFITASILLSEGTQGITIPAKALFTEGDRTYAFVAAGDRRFERRQIVAIADGAGRVRVTSGIRPRELVVVDGAMLLRFRQQQQDQPE